MKQRTHRRGQAIVEFALSATLIFFLLCAAIDLGLIFFAVQGLHNAAQEGATYGSRWLVTDATGKRVLDTTVIKNKVRLESGDKGGIGFVNLLDLNSDGVPDDQQPSVLSNYITVQMLSDSPDYDGDPLNNGTAPGYKPCENAATAGPGGCYAYVTVRANHKIIFPLSPVFTDTIQLTSSFIVPIRDSVNQGDPSGPPPVITTPGPTPNPDSIVITYVGPASSGGRNDTKFEFTAYDSNVGTSNGNGIAKVEFAISSSSGFTYGKLDPGGRFCAFGNNGCQDMDTTQWDTLPNGQTTLVITGTATSTNGATKSVSVSVVVTK